MNNNRRYYTQSPYRALQSYSCRNFFFQVLCESNFSFCVTFEAENSAVNEKLSDKIQLTNQEVGIFVEEQRNSRTVKKKIWMLVSLSSSFRSHLAQVFSSQFQYLKRCPNFAILYVNDVNFLTYILYIFFHEFNQLTFWERF